MDLTQNPSVFNSAATPRHAPVKFTGEGRTYFGIWLTNLLLTILTLGIYGAWAKVRTQQFMSIEIDGHSIPRQPMQILVGRLIAITVFHAFMATVHLSESGPLIHYGNDLLHCPTLGGERITTVLSSDDIVPHVRFNFKGTHWGAMKTFIIFPILGLIPFYLGLPWVNKKVDEYLMSNAYYGEKQFKTDIQTPTYYKAVGTSLLVVLGTAISAGLLAYIMSLAIEGAEPFVMMIFGVL